MDIFPSFWIPAFLEIFKSHFNLIAHVHDTYAFELVAPLTPEKIAQNMPDSPEALGASNLETLFDRRLKDFGEVQDIKGLFSLSLQKAAALAYLKEFDKARILFKEIENTPYFSHFDEVFLTKARKNISHLPHGAPVSIPDLEKV